MKPSRTDLRALARRDPRLAAVMRGLPPFPGFPDPANRSLRSHWRALTRAIVYQQLHGTAARTIHGRICALTPGKDFPAPARLLALRDRELRGAGLSRNKLLALRDLAGRIEDRRLVLRGLGRRSDEDVVLRLTSVRGIGPWTAQMFLMFRLGRLDVMAEADLGVQEGIRLLDGISRRPTPKEALARAEPWRPLRSVGCWAMWRLVERHRARGR